MKNTHLLKKVTVFSLFFLLLYDLNAKPIVYIRVRSGGGLFGYDYVESTFEPGWDYDLVTTNCQFAGFKRCKHSFRSVEDEKNVGISGELLDKVLEAIELQNSSGNNEGKLIITDQYVIFWSFESNNYDSNDTNESSQANGEVNSDSLKLIIYTFEEAQMLHF